jgi:hypothetical protein
MGGMKAGKQAFAKLSIIPAALAQTAASQRANHLIPLLIPAEKTKPGKQAFRVLTILEREKSLELSTYTLARYRSTN